jgi:hypothetical protein
MIRRLALLATATVVVSGCRQANDEQSKPEPEIGRYQMMPNPDGGGFILLDTKTGFPRHCGVAPPQVACGKIANIPDM